MPTCGSLFSGAGLLDAGLAMAGFEHAWVCESDEFRRGLLASRFPGAVVYDDIRTLRGSGMPRLTDEQFAWACGMYDAGWSVADVAAELPVGRQALWQRFKRAGVEMRPQLRYGVDNHFHRGGVFGEDWAHNKVEYAIRIGRLVRPETCETCGGPGVQYKDGRASIQAHHDDYNQPLEVRWLCKGCHHEWHKHNAPVPRAGGDANGSPIAELVDLVAGGFPLGPARAPAAPASRTGSSTPRLFCGTRCGASLGRLDLATCSSRTSQQSSGWLLPQGSLLDPCGESFSETWPRSGSVAVGIASLRLLSELPTSEIVSSSSPKGVGYGPCEELCACEALRVLRDELRAEVGSIEAGPRAVLLAGMLQRLADDAATCDGGTAAALRGREADGATGRSEGGHFAAQSGRCSACCGRPAAFRLATDDGILDTLARWQARTRPQGAGAGARAVGAGSGGASHQRRPVGQPAGEPSGAEQVGACGGAQTTADLGRSTGDSGSDQVAREFVCVLLRTGEAVEACLEITAHSLLPSAPRTSVNGSSPLLATPMARDGRPDGSQNVPSAAGRGTSLMKDLLPLLPTPKASDDKLRRSPADAPVRRGTKLGHALTTQLAGSQSTGATTGPPSPDGKPSTGLRLNPSFVGWMMGTPTCGECGREWTDPDCQHSAMAFMSTAPTSSDSRSATTCSMASGTET